MSSSKSDDCICSDKKKCMEIIMPGILKTLLSFCEYHAFVSNLALFYSITFPSAPSKIKHSLLHKNASAQKVFTNKYEQ